MPALYRGVSSFRRHIHVDIVTDMYKACHRNIPDRTWRLRSARYIKNTLTILAHHQSIGPVMVGLFAILRILSVIGCEDIVPYCLRSDSVMSTKRIGARPS